MFVNVSMPHKIAYYPEKQEYQLQTGKGLPGTFYDPNHAEPTQRLASLGVHEHWNNPQEKKYSRNLGANEGIELLPIKV